MSGTGTDPKRAWIERVLGVSLPVPAREGAARPQPPRAGSTVAFTQARLAWDGTRKHVQSELQRLEAAVLEDCADEPDFATIKGNAKLLYTVLDFLDERLIDKLDEALNAEAGPARKALTDEAREIISEYTDYVANDDLLRDVDDNGFVDVEIIPAVTSALRAIDAQLKAAA